MGEENIFQLNKIPLNFIHKNKYYVTKNCKQNIIVCTHCFQQMKVCLNIKDLDRDLLNRFTH